MADSKTKTLVGGVGGVNKDKGDRDKDKDNKDICIVPVGGKWTLFSEKLKTLISTSTVSKFKEPSEECCTPRFSKDDMDMFGLTPGSDPLVLVVCLKCDRVVKASRFSAHTEQCAKIDAISEDEAAKRKRNFFAKKLMSDGNTSPTSLQRNNHNNHNHNHTHNHNHSHNHNHNHHHNHNSHPHVGGKTQQKLLLQQQLQQEKKQQHPKHVLLRTADGRFAPVNKSNSAKSKTKLAKFKGLPEEDVSGLKVPHVNGKVKDFDDYHGSVTTPPPSHHHVLLDKFIPIHRSGDSGPIPLATRAFVRPNKLRRVVISLSHDPQTKKGPPLCAIYSEIVEPAPYTPQQTLRASKNLQANNFSPIGSPTPTEANATTTTTTSTTNTTNHNNHNQNHNHNHTETTTTTQPPAQPQPPTLKKKIPVKKRKAPTADSASNGDASVNSKPPVNKKKKVSEDNNNSNNNTQTQTQTQTQPQTHQQHVPQPPQQTAQIITSTTLPSTQNATDYYTQTQTQTGTQPYFKQQPTNQQTAAHLSQQIATAAQQQQAQHHHQHQQQHQHQHQQHHQTVQPTHNFGTSGANTIIVNPNTSGGVGAVSGVGPGGVGVLGGMPGGVQPVSGVPGGVPQPVQNYTFLQTPQGYQMSTGGATGMGMMSSGGVSGVSAVTPGTQPGVQVGAVAVPLSSTQNYYLKTSQEMYNQQRAQQQGVVGVVNVPVPANIGVTLSGQSMQNADGTSGVGVGSGVVGSGVGVKPGGLPMNIPITMTVTGVPRSQSQQNTLKSFYKAITPGTAPGMVVSGGVTPQIVAGTPGGMPLKPVDPTAKPLRQSGGVVVGGPGVGNPGVVVGGPGGAVRPRKNSKQNIQEATPPQTVPVTMTTSPVMVNATSGATTNSGAVTTNPGVGAGVVVGAGVNGAGVGGLGSPKMTMLGNSTELNAANFATMQQNLQQQQQMQQTMQQMQQQILMHQQLQQLQQQQQLANATATNSPQLNSIRGRAPVQIRPAYSGTGVAGVSAPAPSNGPGGVNLGPNPSSNPNPSPNPNPNPGIGVVVGTPGQVLSPQMQQQLQQQQLQQQRAAVQMKLGQTTTQPATTQPQPTQPQPVQPTQQPQTVTVQPPQAQQTQPAVAAKPAEEQTKPRRAPPRRKNSTAAASNTEVEPFVL